MSNLLKPYNKEGVLDVKRTIQELPLVSIIITAYNAEKFVKEALLSIINQTYQNIEIIVINDGSTDHTGLLLKKIKKLDNRISIINLKKNLGPSLASNIGINIAKGVYIARMDADDISLPYRIEKQVNYLQNNPKVVIVGGNSYLINEKGEKIGNKKYPVKHKDIYDALFTMNPIQHPNCMINRKLLPKIYYHNHSILAHDLELIFEAAQYGELANLNEITLSYRQWKNSLSLRDPKNTFKATVDVRRKALKEYHYHPSPKGLITHYLQIIVITCIPNQFIYPLFKFIRIDRHFILNNLLKLPKTILGKLAINTIRYKVLRPA